MLQRALFMHVYSVHYLYVEFSSNTSLFECVLCETYLIYMLDFVQQAKKIGQTNFFLQELYTSTHVHG